MIFEIDCTEDNNAILRTFEDKEEWIKNEEDLAEWGGGKVDSAYLANFFKDIGPDVSIDLQAPKYERILIEGKVVVPIVKKTIEKIGFEEVGDE